MSYFPIKIMKQKPQLTDDEIRSHMDFDKLLLLSKEASVIQSIRSWGKLSALAPAVVLIATIVYTIVYTLHQQNPERSNNQSPESTQPIKQDSTVRSNQQPILQKERESQASAKKEIVNKPKQTEAKPIIKPEAKTNELSDSSRNQSLMQFTEAEPVEGYPALYEYFNRELKYPVEVAKDSIEGTVVVSFIIDVDGKPGEIKVINSLGELFDKESIRVIENMPKWKAATINSEAASTRLSIPLTFKILK